MDKYTALVHIYPEYDDRSERISSPILKMATPKTTE
jgi:hypothetical protein